MVLLFLSEPVVAELGNDDDCFELIAALLNNLGAIIWSLITSGGRAEARLWLCNAISSISSITPRQQRDLFLSLLKSKPLKTALAAQIMQMIFEKRPSKAGIILAKRSHMLEDFFKGKSFVFLPVMRPIHYYRLIAFTSLGDKFARVEYINRKKLLFRPLLCAISNVYFEQFSQMRYLLHVLLLEGI